MDEKLKYVIIENLIVFAATSICVTALAFTEKDISPLWGFLCLIGITGFKKKKSDVRKVTEKNP